MGANHKTKAVVLNPDTKIVYILSCSEYMAKVGVDWSDIITEGSDNVTQFLGQPLSRLETKMKVIGDFKKVVL